MLQIVHIAIITNGVDYTFILRNLLKYQRVIENVSPLSSSPHIFNVGESSRYGVTIIPVLYIIVGMIYGLIRSTRLLVSDIFVYIRYPLSLSL